MAALKNSVWDDLLAEFPALMDPQDLHYGNRKMRAQYLRQLLEKCNRISRIPFTMEMLKKKLKSLNRKRTRRLQRQRLSGEDSRGDCWLEQETCSDSTEPTNQIQRVTQKMPEQQAGLFTKVFHCCGVCGEIKGECSKGIDRSYIVNNKTTLAMNNQSTELDFNKDIMVCQNCDVKLKEMYEFVKLVSSAQYKFRKNIVNTDLTENKMPIDNGYDVKLITDDQTVTDSELVKPTLLHKRKCEGTPEMKEKRRVTIVLNISDDRSTMDDIEAKYQMFKNGEVSLAKSADAVSKAVTENNEDAIFKLKKKIEQDMHKGVNETGEVPDADRRNDIESELTSDRRYENSEDIILDVKKEIASDGILNEVNETREISTDDDKMNDAGTERTCDSEKTNATVSKTSDLANKGEPMCVMPQSELILLVESIVSRMLNK